MPDLAASHEVSGRLLMPFGPKQASDQEMRPEEISERYNRLNA